MDIDSALPQQFIERMQLQLGNDFEPYIQSYEKQSPVSVRLNTEKHNQPLALKQVLWEPNGYYLPARPVFTLDPLLHAGLYYVQEASSMFLGHTFRQLVQTFNDKPIKVLDLCGAPGGKATHLASALNSDSILVANEVIKSRAHILYENVVKWGLPNVLVSQNDPKQFQKLRSFFDIIVVDAPCSGEGLFRRDINATQEWSIENTQLCSQRQQRIVADVWDSLAPGGFLIYSTCTFNPDENEKNIDWLVQNFQAEGVTFNVPDDWSVRLIDYKAVKGYQFLPHKVDGEGFFIAAVQKTTGEKFNQKKEKQDTNTLSVRDARQFKSWLINFDETKFIKTGELIIGVPKPIQPFYSVLQQHLNLLKSGIAIGTTKGNKTIPAHELALSTLINQHNFAFEELTEYEALTFLHKEAFALRSAEKGYHLLKYRGNPLGWMNNLGNRGNNNYPQTWKIRMNLPDEKTFTTQGFLY